MELKTASSGLAQDRLAETGLGMPVGAPVACPTLTAWVQVEPWHHPPLFLLRLQALLTLFAKSFASFNHSTCALSVPCQ